MPTVTFPQFQDEVQMVLIMIVSAFNYVHWSSPTNACIVYTILVQCMSHWHSWDDIPLPSLHAKRGAPIMGPSAEAKAHRDSPTALTTPRVDCWKNTINVNWALVAHNNVDTSSSETTIFIWHSDGYRLARLINTVCSFALHTAQNGTVLL